MANQEKKLDAQVPIDRRRRHAELVGWCPECETFQPLEDGACLGEEHEQTNGRLRKRRMYICRENEHNHAYFDRKEFLEHDHSSCEC